MAGLVLVTAPTQTPITVSEAKDQARVCNEDDDGLITDMIKAATTFLEQISHRSFVETEWDLFLDDFPGETPRGNWGVGSLSSNNFGDGIPPFVSRFNDRAFRPWRSNLLSVTSLKYNDTDGVEQILVEGNDYVVDTATKPGRVVEAVDTCWPDTIDQVNSVVLRFKAGYGTDATSVPQDVKHMVKAMVAYWYEYREPYITGTIVNELPMYLQAMLAPLKVYDFA